MMSLLILAVVLLYVLAPLVGGVLVLVVEQRRSQRDDVWSASALEAEARVDAATRRALQEMRDAVRFELRQQAPRRRA